MRAGQLTGGQKQCQAGRVKEQTCERQLEGTDELEGRGRQEWKAGGVEGWGIPLL